MVTTAVSGRRLETCCAIEDRVKVYGIRASGIARRNSLSGGVRVLSVSLYRCRDRDNPPPPGLLLERLLAGFHEWIGKVLTRFLG
jgi:hypothetical protein